MFTPYWRVWRQAPRRALLEPPRIRPVTGVSRGHLDLPVTRASSGSPAGGETEGRKRLRRFLDGGLARYQRLADDLDADATSRLSPYLHFGCVSPLELDLRVTCERFRRQLCWRDFFLQLLAANPNLPREDYRHRPIAWRDDDAALAAWRSGQTGYPIVDAAMRQLAAEGWLHNRVRLVVASFLTKTLRIHWSHGADHFAALLVDGDLASNAGNWQWMAGTGTDPRPNRIINPTRQARRHDPDGEYVRTHLPELADIPGPGVHRPWTLDRKLDYPPPIVDPPRIEGPRAGGPSMDLGPDRRPA
jgi:deoxyribodipyrimidine photo-lyase